MISNRGGICLLIGISIAAISFYGRGGVDSLNSYNSLFPPLPDHKGELFQNLFAGAIGATLLVGFVYAMLLCGVLRIFMGPATPTAKKIPKKHTGAETVEGKERSDHRSQHGNT